MYRLRESTGSPHRLRSCLWVPAAAPEWHGPAVTLQEDCNGAGPILLVPKTKKIAFGTGVRCFIQTCMVHWKCGAKRKKRKISGPGVPPDSASFVGLAVHTFVSTSLYCPNWSYAMIFSVSSPETFPATLILNSIPSSHASLFLPLSSAIGKILWKSTLDHLIQPIRAI
jgi:hypothetical protein